MPLAKIYVNEGQYDEARLTKISEAVQAALRGTLGVPPDDFFKLIFEMPRNRYLHTASRRSNGNCADGTYGFSQYKSGTCSSHGGVDQWLR